MIAPKPSGIAAATGERKTSRRTSRRNGRASSSPCSVEEIDSSWIAREMRGVAGLGGADRRVDLASIASFEPGRPSSLTAVFTSTWKSARISARRGSGAAARRCPGPRARAWSPSGRGAGRGSAPGPGDRSPPPGRAAGSRRGRCRRSAGDSSWLAREESVPGMSSVVGSSLPSTPVPMIPSAASTSAATTSTARGWRSVNGGRRPESVPSESGRPLLLLLRTRGSLTVRGSGRERTDAEDCVKNVCGGNGAGAVVAASAYALRSAGRATSSSSPTAASRRRRCPSTSWRRSRCTATARSRPATARLPPILDQITFWFDKNGEVVTKGLPVCTRRNWRRPRPAGAQALPGSIVGTGFGKAVVNFPEQGPIPAQLGDHARPRRPLKISLCRHPHRSSRRSCGTPVYGQPQDRPRDGLIRASASARRGAGCPGGRLQAKGQFSFKTAPGLQGDRLKPCQGS